MIVFSQCCEKKNIKKELDIFARLELYATTATEQQKTKPIIANSLKQQNSKEKNQ